MIRGLLIASAALNIFLLSFITGDFSRPVRAAQSLSGLASHYPDEIRQDLRANVIAERRALGQGLRAFNAVRAELFEAMRAPEFNRAQVQALMAEVRVETTKLQALLQAATLAAVEAAPADMRAKIGTPQLGDRMIGFQGE
ncbi:MAG: periplasmic heavy metal sensor [Pseudomonadota bacterium]